MASQTMARGLADLPERYNLTVDLIGRNLDAGRGDKIAVIDHLGTTTYAELSRRIDKAAGVFASLGLQREQRVLLCLLDTVDFPTIFLGAIKAGIVPVPLNTLLTAKDYRWIFENSRASAVFVASELAESWHEIAAANPSIRFISVGGGPWADFEDLLQSAEPMTVAADTHRDEVAFWLYTSGSTGNPKGAMHVHGTLRLTLDLYALPIAGYNENDVVLSVAKQFFAYGLGNSLAFPFGAGATVVLNKERSSREIIGRLLKEHRVTVLGGVPTFFSSFITGPDAPSSEDLASLRIATSAGECLPPHIGRAFTERYGAEIIEGLGSTEMAHIFLSHSPGSVRYGCTGRPVPGYELRIIDDAGNEAGPDEIGELQVKGPTAALGYWNNRVKSQATFQGEWTRTGDKYSVSRDGWYSFQGRSDDMLKVGGIYVSPTEVEEAVASHESVLEAAVVGAADPEGLIKPRAYVVLRDGVKGSAELEATLKAHVKSRLAPYKYPRWFVFMDELPKTATGKIQRFRLRESS